MGGFHHTEPNLKKPLLDLVSTVVYNFVKKDYDVIVNLTEFAGCIYAKGTLVPFAKGNAPT